MISHSPEQELYDAVFSMLSTLGCTVYTHSPPPNTKMPYIRMGNTQLVPRLTKTKLLGSVYLDFSVWGGALDRGKISGLMINAMELLSRIKETNLFHFEMNLERSTYELLADQSSEDDLWQARASTEWATYAR